MHRFALPCVLASFLAGCSSGSSGGEATASPGAGGAAGAGAGGSSSAGASGASGASAAGASGGTAFTCPASITPGYNQGFMAGDRARKFFADFPSNTATPPAVVFSYHGFGDSADAWRTYMALDPNTDPDFPFILITPDDLGLFPFNDPQGLGWAIFTGEAASPNPEGDLFETALACLTRDNQIDAKRVYIVGFSAGGILANLMHMRYQAQGKLAATASFSGAWFDDPAQTATVHPLNFKVDYHWDALDPARAGTILMAHGGPNDVFSTNGQQVIDFEQVAGLAIPFLGAAKRTVIDCKHTSGHAPPPGIHAKQVTAFFKAHKAGEPSPYLTAGVDPILPTSCALVQ